MNGIWNCSKCGDVAEYPNPQWRWNGYRWEHLHDGIYEPARCRGIEEQALASNLDDLRALAVQLAEALAQYVPKPGDLFTTENIGTFDIIERAASALDAARKAGLIK